MGHVCPDTPIVLLLALPLPCCIVPIVTIHGPSTEAVGGLTPRWETCSRASSPRNGAKRVCALEEESCECHSGSRQAPRGTHHYAAISASAFVEKKKGTGGEEEEREEGGG